MHEALERAVAKLEEIGQAVRSEEGAHVYKPQVADVEADLDYDAAPARGALLDNGEPIVDGSRFDELHVLAARLSVEDGVLKDAKTFKERLVTFTASDETKDRYGDRILVDGTLKGRSFKGADGKAGKGWLLKNYVRNPVFMAFHEYSPEMSGNQFAGIPIGLGLDTWANESRGKKRLSQTVLFGSGASNPLAPLLLSAYKKERLLRAVSVGFMPLVVHEPEDDSERKELGLGRRGFIFAEQELWENSAVSIPANPNALVTQLDVTNEKGLVAFGDAVREIAPEVGYALRSAAFTGRDTVFLDSADLGAETIPKEDAADDGNSDDVNAEVIERLQGMEGRLAAIEESIGVLLKESRKAFAPSSDPFGSIVSNAAREARELAARMRDGIPKEGGS